MLYTREWVYQKYNECNENYFDGKLPSISPYEIKLTRNKNPWGRGGCKSFTKNWSTGQYEARGVYLELSNYYDTSEKDKLEVLVHEMCHIYEYFVEPKYYIECVVKRRWTYHHPKHGHGTVFYEQAKRLEQYGFHVQRFVDDETHSTAEISDEIAQKHRGKLETGLHVLKFHLSKWVKGYEYGYVVCGLSNYKEWLEYAMGSSKFDTIVDCITHDKKILAYTISRGVGRYFLKDGPLDNILADVTFESEKIVKEDGKPVQTQATELFPLQPVDEPDTEPEKPKPEPPKIIKPEPPKPQSNRRYTFSIPVLSNGKPTYFTITNKTEDEAKKLMRERFPKWSDEIINEKFKKFTTMKESIEITREELMEMIGRVVDRVKGEKDFDAELKAAIADMPDEIPGHIDDN